MANIKHQQHEQQQYKHTTQSQKDAFQKKYPKEQLIKKEELAKYLMAGVYLQPDIVSKGSEKNMIAFAEKISDLWQNPANINEVYFKQAVAYSILFKKVDLIVSKAKWNYVGLPKSNVVPYTISKFIHSIPKGYKLDLMKIWEKQDLSNNLIEELDKLGKITLDFILDSNNTLVTEYAKKAETWKKFMEKDFSLSSKIENDLISEKFMNQTQIAAKKEAIESNKVNFEMEVARLAKLENGMYWHNLVLEGKKRKIISPKEEDIIIKYVAELGSSNPKRLPSPAQMKVAWEVRKRLDENGALV